MNLFFPKHLKIQPYSVIVKKYDAVDFLFFFFKENETEDGKLKEH